MDLQSSFRRSGRTRCRVFGTLARSSPLRPLRKLAKAAAFCGCTPPLFGGALTPKRSTLSAAGSARGFLRKNNTPLLAGGLSRSNPAWRENTAHQPPARVEGFSIIDL